MFKSGPNYSKLKTNLRLVINRLKLLEKKKTEQAQKARREIADYLQVNKVDRARIRVEHIVREDYLVEAMEILEMYCDLLLARFGLIQTQKEIDAGLEEAIASIIWATPRLQADVAELKPVLDQLVAKYTKEYADACRTNGHGNVNEKLIHKLDVHAPPKILVERYLIEIAKTYNVEFEPDQSVLQYDEVLAEEGMLLDFGDENRRPSGGGKGLPVMEPTKGGPPAPGPMNYPAMNYPPMGQPSGPPPLPQAPPAGSPYPNGPTHHAPPFTMPSPPGQKPPAPSYNDVMNDSRGPPGASGGVPRNEKPPLDDMPELPSVPGSVPGGASVGGEDVDFDDLTRRFEELKKKK